MSVQSSRLLASSALALGLVVSPALADGTTGSGWYAGVFAGAAWPEDMDLSATAWIEPDTAFALGAVVGKQISSSVRGELEVSHWGAGGDIGCSGKCIVTDFDVDALTVLGNVWIDIPAGHDITPYVGGGIGLGGVGIDDGASDETSWGFAWQLGAGLRFGVGPSTTIDVGYRYKTVYADANDFGYASDPDAAAHIAQVGVTFAL